jgi:flagellar hook-basal body complex protein FliE
MTPDQILNHINNAKMSGINSVGATPSSGLAEAAFGELRKKLSHSEDTINKSLINEASLLDVVNTTNDTKNTLQVMVAVRDKMLEAFEKVMAMQI